MYRSELLANLARVVRIARECDERQMPTAEGIERFTHGTSPTTGRVGRREWLVRVGRTAAAGVVASAAAPVLRLAAWSRGAQSGNVGIVGAGLAGLACADELAGGRHPRHACTTRTRAPAAAAASLRGLFPGQVAERGGEFIDNLHKTMLGYARRFDLDVEDVSKEPGEIFYYFDGQRCAGVGRRRRVPRVRRGDARRLAEALAGGRRPIGTRSTDVQLDRTSLLAYLEGQNGAGAAGGTGRSRRRSSRRTSPSTAWRPTSRAASTSCSSSTPIGDRSSRRSACSATSATTCSTATTASSTG